jgi:4-alpha-glucanotransferase
MTLTRSGGILLHITSIPGKYGIGTFGRKAYEFVDFLIASRQKIWQLLPLGHTGYGDSPYQCYSAFAGNPMLTDLEILVEKGFLTSDELEVSHVFSEDAVEYEKVYAHKMPLLEKAAGRFLSRAPLAAQTGFEIFCEQNAYWLHDYALFIALKHKHGGKPWWEWPDRFRLREDKALEEITYELNSSMQLLKVIQFFFYSQWIDLKSYANRNGIQIIGDIPLYIAHDSADAWCHYGNFWFDEDRNPVKVAGVPPDYFSETGQLWGNPLYNWAYLKENGFSWWIERVKANFVLYDYLRIDHFRGLAAYWAIPFGEKTAINGEWMPAPGRDLLEAIREQLGDLPIIAEDLGVITDDVIELRRDFSFPGMKILQFAFDSDEENDFLPHTYPRSCIAYTGTHDNDTTLGWFVASKEQDRQTLREYFNPDERDISWSFIKLAWSSVADFAIVPLQDILKLGSEARMNIPGTASGNWKWRFKAGSLTDDHALRLKKITKTYGRG